MFVSTILLFKKTERKKDDYNCDYHILRRADVWIYKFLSQKWWLLKFSRVVQMFKIAIMNSLTVDAPFDLVKNWILIRFRNLGISKSWFASEI